MVQHLCCKQLSALYSGDGGMLTAIKKWPGWSCWLEPLSCITVGLSKEWTAAVSPRSERLGVYHAWVVACHRGADFWEPFLSLFQQHFAVPELRGHLKESWQLLCCSPWTLSSRNVIMSSVMVLIVFCGINTISTTFLELHLLQHLILLFHKHSSYT